MHQKQGLLDSFGAIYLFMFWPCMWGLGFQNHSPSKELGHRLFLSFSLSLSLSLYFSLFLFSLWCIPRQNFMGHPWPNGAISCEKSALGWHVYRAKLARKLFLSYRNSCEKCSATFYSVLKLGWPATEWETGPEPKIAEKLPAKCLVGPKNLATFPPNLQQDFVGENQKITEELVQGRRETNTTKPKKESNCGNKKYDKFSGLIFCQSSSFFPRFPLGRILKGKPKGGGFDAKGSIEPCLWCLRF